MRTIMIATALALGAGCMRQDETLTLDAPPACLTTGGGAQGDQCCIWDHRELTGGPQSCATGLWCHYDGGSSQNAGTCTAPPADPAGFYVECDPAKGSEACEIDGACVLGPDPGRPTTHLCMVVCKPWAGDQWQCGTEHVCKAITDDGSVGICVPMRWA